MSGWEILREEDLAVTDDGEREKDAGIFLPSETSAAPAIANGKFNLSAYPRIERMNRYATLQEFIRADASFYPSGDFQYL